MANDFRGKFLWHELMTPDPEGAKRFYPTVTGWGVGEMPEMDYTVWTTGGAGVGGMLKMPDHVKAPPHWLPYMGSPDVDATHRRALELGATSYVPPKDIPDVGRFCVLADPQGAVFGVLQPIPRDRPERPQTGSFSWNELSTTDPDAAFGFYADLFGWEKIDAFDMGPDGLYQMYGQNGQMYGGIYRKPAHVPASYWLCYVNVPDVHEAARVATENGGKVVVEPMEVPGGDWIVQIADPAGAMFAVHQNAAAGAA